MSTQAQAVRASNGSAAPDVGRGDLIEEPIITIRPARGWQLLNVAELWQHRELLYFLTWRDVKVRYKQTLLGAAWAILQPVLMMVVFTVFLGRMAGVPSGDLPYPLFVYAGLLPWTFFASAVSAAGNSVIGSERLITKVYFPRLAIPFASVGAAFVDFCIAFGVLVCLMVYYDVGPSLSLLFVPVLLAVTVLAALGVGTILAALNVSYRDFRYVIPFMVQLWMFATPSIYMEPRVPEPAAQPDAVVDPSGKSRTVATTVVADVSQDARLAGGDASQQQGGENRYRKPLTQVAKAAIAMNPMTGLIAAFRAATLGTSMPWNRLVGSSCLIAMAFLVGCFYFRRVEDTFADVI